VRLEDQVAPLALAQRMKELGFPQGLDDAAVYFFWVQDRMSKWPEVVERGEAHSDRDLTPICAAPTVAEMGVWLPDTFASGKQLVIEENDPLWHAYPGLSYGEPMDPETEGHTEAEARARLLIALAEAGLLATEGHETRRTD
jgi:hypothetical protein